MIRRAAPASAIAGWLRKGRANTTGLRLTRSRHALNL